MVPKHVRSPSLFLEAQTALSVELVQTLFHISSGCHCHFWWLLLLCCLNCSSASADNSELPKALRHQQDHQLCHLTQHRHAHSILPLDRPTSTPCSCSSSAPGTQGTIPPPTEPWDHHLTADLPHNSSSPDMEERLPPARDLFDLFVWPTNILTKTCFSKKVLEQASLLQYTHLAHLNAEEIFSKRKIKVWAPLKEVEVVLSFCWVFFLQPITPSPLLYFSPEVSISTPTWNDIFLVEPTLKQAKF